MIPRKLQINYKNKVFEIDSIFRTAKNGKTLVYLHCGAGSKEDFQPIFQSRELESYGILAFDFPGCGNSSYPEDSKIEVIDLVTISTYVIREFNIQNIIVVGHSLGGLIGLFLATTDEQVVGFINVEGNLSKENCLFSEKVVKSSFEEFKNKLLPNLINTCSSSNNLGMSFGLF